VTKELTNVINIHNASTTLQLGSTISSTTPMQQMRRRLRTKVTNGTSKEVTSDHHLTSKFFVA